MKEHIIYDNYVLASFLSGFYLLVNTLKIDNFTFILENICVMLLANSLDAFYSNEKNDIVINCVPFKLLLNILIVKSFLSEKHT